VKFLKVKREKAQETRKRLADESILDKSYPVEREGDYVYFPVTSEAEDADIVEREAQKRRERPRSLKEALRGILTDEELLALQSSYNVVGDIAVLEMDECLRPKRMLIGGAMLRTFKNVKTVALKTEQVSGEYRVPGVEVIAGEKRTETIHREHGCVYKLDVAAAYFSPRLGHERMRIAELIRDGERVLVLFAGVGPYAVLAAKRTKADVTAVELNPKAVEYMRWNVLKNRVNVDVVEGDARKVTPTLGLFDRIIMPLPKQADTFLDVVLPALKGGGMVHCYVFARDGSEAADIVSESVGRLDRKAMISGAVECGSYSPCMARYCVDFNVE
jgi:tRNA (guanine37-N1)-methyltransferase